MTSSAESSASTSSSAPTKKLPVHRIRGGTIATISALSMFLMMSNESQIARGALWGVIASFAFAFGILDALGMLMPKAGTESSLGQSWFAPRDGEPTWAAPRMTIPIAIVCLLVGIALTKGRPALCETYTITECPFDVLPWAIAAGLLALLVSGLRRPGLLMFSIASLLFLPLLGNYGLWDPWETHYGEVAREILSRDDWISLWWAQENWFWSKPIFIFWSEAISMSSFGVDFHPDANPERIEWAIRFPIYLVSTGAALCAHAAISKVYGRRTGIIAGIVIVTMPHFFLLAHQAITDMPFVGTMTMAMSMLIIAFSEDDDTKLVEESRVGPFAMSLQHVILFAITVVALPQAAYLITRNVTLVHNAESPFGFAWHMDRFFSGSAYNDGRNGDLIPGNQRGIEESPAVPALLAQPAFQGLLWLIGLAAIIWIVSRERRRQRLFMYAFYFFCALSFMAKGIGGVALPGAVAFLYLLVSGRWSLLLSGRLRVFPGILIVLVVGVPWFVSMYMRHGVGFTDRLLIHDHINRLGLNRELQGVHGDTGSIQYFITQLGYALFPWVGFVPVAIVMVFARAREAVLSPVRSVSAAAAEPVRDAKYETAALITLWFAVAFTLFSAMITKFHHYIFPAVPPLALLVGILVSSMMERETDPANPSIARRRLIGTILAGLASLFVVLAIAGSVGNIRGVIPPDVPTADWSANHKVPMALVVVFAILGVASFVGSFYLLRAETKQDEAGTEDDGPIIGMRGIAAGAAVVVALVLVAFVGRDLSWVTTSRPYGYERLIQLFIYNYSRPWPEYLDYRPIYTGFGITSVLVVLLMLAPRLRAIALRSMLGLALVFAAWALDFYLVDLAPHWGQRTIVKRYYELRAGPEEPLVSWQMNWKGENLYTGNRTSVFPDIDNAKIREWFTQNRGRTVYFLSEHTRLESLRSLLGAGRPLTQVTTMRDCNKFVISRATI